MTQSNGPQAKETKFWRWIAIIAALWIVFAGVLVAVAQFAPEDAPYTISKALTVAVISGSAFLVGSLLIGVARRFTSSDWPTYVVIIFVAGAFTVSKDRVYDWLVKPEADAYVFLQEMERQPALQIMKKMEPKAYDDFTSRATSLLRDGGSKLEMEKFAETYIAKFRRENAQLALAARPQFLEKMARSYIEILEHLQSRDAQLCVEFIFQGFASDSVRNAARKSKDFQAILQRNMINLLESMADGKEQNMTHGAMTPGDAEVFAQALVNGGWSQGQLSLLSSTEKLKELPAAEVCRLYRDIFLLPLSLPSEATKSRILQTLMGPILKN